MILRDGSPRWRVTPSAPTRPTGYGLPYNCVKHADAFDVDRRVWTCQKIVVIGCFAQAGEQELGFSDGLCFEAELVGRA
jgi:hypothetical protein